MNILAIDTSLQRCSAAIIRSDGRGAENFQPMGKGHAEALAPVVQSILGEAKIEIKDLSRVVVTIGPGGFTGVRVGLAFARGLALGTRIGVVGVTTLAALAASVSEERRAETLIAAVIDARRGQVYGALYDERLCEVEAAFVADPVSALVQLEKAAAGRKLAFVGSGVGILPGAAALNLVGPPDGQIDPLALANLGLRAAAPKRPPAPLYLRAPDAEPSRQSSFAQSLKV